jgi:hypothetical protein
MVSALAGGGLTAASLSGQLSGSALGTGIAAGAVPGEGSTPVTSTPGTSAPEAGQASTTTSTPSPAPAGAPPTSTTTIPVPSAPAVTTPKAPTVLVRHRQKSTGSSKAGPSITNAKKPSAAKGKGTVKPKASGPNNVALSPQLVAAQAGALAAALASSAASAQALAFYRIPPFLLPIYKAAAAQYGVPWQILAAINEIETNYGSDQSVSTAGAVGWMQFMPATWLQYGVDALNAGVADPYNPVDAIFAAARYLRAAGAASDLHAAILAYNHSEEYVSSVLLRAKLISTYPRPVVATLTGLMDARLPVRGKQLTWGALLPSRSSATAKSALAAPAPSAGAAAPASPARAANSAAPGSSAAPAPTAAVAAAGRKPGARAAAPLQLVDLMSAPNATVVAVQDGRIVQLGETRELGKYLILRDVYGDVFTYAGLGSITSTYRPPQGAGGGGPNPAGIIANTQDRALATAARRAPVTLQVRSPARPTAHAGGAAHPIVPADPVESVPAGMGKVRLFAHPGNPDAVAAAASTARRAGTGGAARARRLGRGSLVAAGSVLGHVHVPAGAVNGHLRFAIRPAGDSVTVDPRPILAGWAQLDAALHPQGAKAATPLVGATASDVFLLSSEELQRTVLSDPGITLDACGQADIGSGAVDRRVLAVLAFLSRSGLNPTVSGLRCGAGASKAATASKAQSIDTAEISVVNGVPIAAHQGPGTVTDLAIRTLLSLPGEFLPARIASLMRYPGAANTHATPHAWKHIEIGFRPASAGVASSPAASGAAAHSAGAPRTATSQLVVGGELTPAQWDGLVKRIAALPAPTVKVKPSPSAIPDTKHP